MLGLDSALQRNMAFGADVAASIRAFFKANISRILDDLRNRGVNQKQIAKDWGVPPTIVSQMKRGDYFPSGPRMDDLLEVINRYQKVEPEEFFRDPSRHLMASADLIAELARRAGYEVTKKP